MLGPDGQTMPVCEIDLRRVYHEVKRRNASSSWSVGGNWPEALNTLVLSEQNGKTAITKRALFFEGGPQRGA